MTSRFSSFLLTDDTFLLLQPTTNLFPIYLIFIRSPVNTFHMLAALYDTELEFPCKRSAAVRKCILRLLLHFFHEHVDNTAWW